MSVSQIFMVFGFAYGSLFNQKTVSEDIKDEVSLTSGHDYKTSTVTAASGKKKYSFFSQKVLRGC